MEEAWIKIYEVEDYQKTDEPIWLEQILIDNNIPYNNEIEEYWIGTRFPKYKKRLKIFVPKKYEKTVEKYIEDFQDSKSIIKDGIEELKDINDDENDVEIKRYNNIRKIGFTLLMGFILIATIFGILGTVGTIMTNI